ncbi:MFS transporter [Piscinibacter sakaiensis]|uniref:MFS transporter n=1 Tax=Piscinibacter sakaiensis TaxID=1547922 RepID=UPI003AAEFC6B
MNPPSEPRPAAPDPAAAAGPPQSGSSASIIGPLRDPVFRMLWLAWLAANVTMWMNDVASAWLMTSLTDSVVMVALVQAASTLPVFVLGLPSGALADIVDRRRYFAMTQLWVALVAVLLGVLALTEALSAPLLLALTFANGIGMAMRWPVFAAIVPEVVKRPDLPSALALNGIAMNMSRVIGPVVAGALLASAGSPYVFLLNAILSVSAFFLILRWRSQRKASALPGERFLGAMRVGVQHVRESPRMRVVLVRIFLFFLQTTALTALLPLIARAIGGGAGTFTMLLAAMGTGAVIVALFLLPMLRGRLDRDDLVRWGTVIHAVAAVVVVLSPTIWLAVPAMMIAGMMWLAVANSLTLAAQMALPDWVRARGMSIYQMALMGGSAAGAALWGYVASHSTLAIAIISASVAGPLVLLLTRRLTVGGVADEDLTLTSPISLARPPVIELHGDEGPVMVTVEYHVDPARAAEFSEVMRETRQARLRQGALSWGLFRDTADPGRYIEYFLDESWIEHQRRLERFTNADVGLRARRLSFQLGDELPLVNRYIADSIDR